jgi:two-component system repressor protein LuxO
MEPTAKIDTSDSPSILVIDDEPSLLRFFEYNVRALGYRVRTGGSLRDLFRLLEEESFAAVLLDLMLPDGEALEHIPKIIELYPKLSVILVSAHGTIPKAVTAIKHGAVNFIQKPVNLETLENVVANAIELWRLKRENDRLRRRLDPRSQFHGMIGQSEVMQAVYEMIESVAATMSPVMITGESGTGKELVARAIHASGPRAKKPFIAINCAAIPRDLLESEIFGHEKGAFTGAIEKYQGCFERADKGTLFLDEIAEMDINLQVKLLRLIQEQSFFRIGGTQQIQVNVRILAATNKDPLEMVQQNRFREDLFYRLNVLPIHLPPLRERREDIALLATRFLHELSDINNRNFQGFELDAMIALEDYYWTGNIRELRNVIEQVVVLNDTELITLKMLPDRIRNYHPGEQAADNGAPARPEAVAAHASGSASPNGVKAIRPFWQTERDEIQRALTLCKGNVQEVARRLEISAATLYRKIEKYGLVK